MIRVGIIGHLESIAATISYVCFKDSIHSAMLLKLIQSMLSGGPYYIRLRTNLIQVQDISNKLRFEEMPVIAIARDPGGTVLAIGQSAAGVAAASMQAYDLVNPFDHPRTIIADFIAGQKVLQYCMRKVAANKVIRASPIVVMQVLERNEGGLTQIEVRALQELAIGAGAREAYIWTGQELTDKDFESKVFPGDYWQPYAPKWAKNK